MIRPKGNHRRLRHWRKWRKIERERDEEKEKGKEQERKENKGKKRKEKKSARRKEREREWRDSERCKNKQLNHPVGGTGKNRRRRTLEKVEKQADPS